MNYSLRTRLTLSYLVITMATAGLVVLLANRITANRFNYMVSRAGQIRARNLSPWFANYYAQVGSWDGVDTFIEFGPGNVLTGLLKRIDKSATGVAVNNPAGIEKALETLKNL